MAFLACGFAVQLDKLGVVHIATERALNGFQIRFVAVSGQLYAVGQPGRRSSMKTIAYSLSRPPTM